MVSRKINTDAIDENLLIASIGKSKIGTTTASILDGGWLEVPMLADR